MWRTVWTVPVKWHHQKWKTAGESSVQDIYTLRKAHMHSTLSRGAEESWAAPSSHIHCEPGGKRAQVESLSFCSWGNIPCGVAHKKYLSWSAECPGRDAPSVQAETLRVSRQRRSWPCSVVVLTCSMCSPQLSCRSSASLSHHQCQICTTVAEKKTCPCHGIWLAATVTTRQLLIGCHFCYQAVSDLLPLFTQLLIGCHLAVSDLLPLFTQLLIGCHCCHQAASELQQAVSGWQGECSSWSERDLNWQHTKQDGCAVGCVRTAFPPPSPPPPPPRPPAWPFCTQPALEPCRQVWVGTPPFFFSFLLAQP